MQFLVNTPDAQTFMQMARTESGCRAYLGDSEQLDSAVGPDIAASNVELRSAADKVFALANDKTRSEPERHQAAQQLGEKVIERLTKTKAAIEQRASDLLNTGLGKAEMLFAPDPARGQLDSEIRGWIAEQMKKPEGISKVRALVASDKRLASVVYHSPQYLIGIEASLHETLKMEALHAHFPETYRMLEQSANLSGLPKKYDAIVSKIRSSFANSHVAAQASTRVSL